MELPSNNWIPFQIISALTAFVLKLNGTWGFDFTLCVWQLAHPRLSRFRTTNSLETSWGWSVPSSGQPQLVSREFVVNFSGRLSSISILNCGCLPFTIELKVVFHSVKINYKINWGCLPFTKKLIEFVFHLYNKLSLTSILKINWSHLSFAK